MTSVGKVQIIQTQVDINQLHAEANALRDHNVRQTTVTPTPEGEKLRLRRREKKDSEEEKRGQEGEKKEKSDGSELKRRSGEHRRISITV